MKKLLLLLVAGMTLSFAAPSNMEVNEEVSGFCEGWDDGYQQALDDCLRVGLTPLCPLEPINSNGYKTGYGKGYAAAQATHCG